MRLVNGDMSKISDQIMEGMKTAMRAKDSVTLNTLRALKTALTNTAIAKGGLGTQLEEAEELAVVRKQIKQREDSTEQFRSARNWPTRKKRKSPSSSNSCLLNSPQRKRRPCWKPS